MVWVWSALLGGLPTMAAMCAGCARATACATTTTKTTLRGSGQGACAMDEVGAHLLQGPALPAAAWVPCWNTSCLSTRCSSTWWALFPWQRAAAHAARGPCLCISSAGLQAYRAAPIYARCRAGNVAACDLLSPRVDELNCHCYVLSLIASCCCCTGSWQGLEVASTAMQACSSAPTTATMLVSTAAPAQSTSAWLC